MHHHRARTRTLRGLLTALAGILLALAPAQPGFAHAALVATDPADGAAPAAAPAEVTATFSEPLDAASTEIAVTGPGGMLIDAGTPSYEADSFTQPMRYLGPGEYTVAFRVISEDGHRVDGAVAFTVDDVAPELIDEDAAIGAAPPGTAGEGDTEAAPDAEGGIAAPAATAVSLLLALGLAGAIALTVRRRRRRTADH